MMDEAGRVLVFRVGDLVCAAGMDAVREIMPINPAARVPGASAAVQGLVNVRGSLVPVVDGRLALNRGPAAAAGSTVLLDVGHAVVGFIVDEVLDLITIPPEALMPRDQLPGIDPSIVRAVAQHDDHVLVILDVQALVGPLLPT